MNEILNSNDFLLALDITATIVGLVYIWLEYRASIYLWIAGIIMPAIDIFLYYEAGLYADFGMAIYYTLAALYGYAVWKWGKKRGTAADEQLPITRFPRRKVLPVALLFAVAWAAIYEILIHFTNSDVPITDSFANALSFVGLWALARKYLEQWMVWIVVDVVLSALYIYKGIPFKASLYALYVVIAVAGYFKWKKMMTAQPSEQYGKS
ncbi:MAG: nicotinamide riboside transporter PnuC [Prevotella sp.]|nr:nicotinamide riboside transporter PnuC [Prevotella sp.]